MASNSKEEEKKKLRVLLLPFFGTSHIQPFTEFAISLALANDAVEATVAVTPANVALVESLLLPAVDNVKVVCYPFPRVEGLGVGVENSAGKGATADESLRIVVAATDESVTRPVQEALIRAQCPDAIVTDLLFPWSVAIAGELGVPCVAFNVIGAFPMLVIRHLAALQLPADDAQAQVAAVKAGISEAEVPGWVRKDDFSVIKRMNSLEAECFGMVMNTPVELEEKYCEVYTRAGYVKRAYFVGPLPLLLQQQQQLRSAEKKEDDKYGIMEWLDAKAERSVLYISLGRCKEAHVKDGELDEIAAALEETSPGESSFSFVWVVRGKEHWTPPAGWEDRVKHRGLLIRTQGSSQTAILGHKAVGAFVTHCGWKSMQETVAAGVPVLAWPSTLLEQHITERMLTEVLGMGDRLAAGTGSKDLARAITTFMRPGGPGDAARVKLMELAPKVHAAVEEGGSSHHDLHRLVDHLLIATAAAAATAKRSTT